MGPPIGLNTWRSRRVCKCVHHAAVRHRSGFHCNACNGASGALLEYGSGHVQGPVASSLAVYWDDILHVLGLRIVVQGSGGRQARGPSVAWQAQAAPRVDVPKVPIRLSPGARAKGDIQGFCGWRAWGSCLAHLSGLVSCTAGCTPGEDCSLGSLWLLTHGGAQDLDGWFCEGIWH